MFATILTLGMMDALIACNTPWTLMLYHLFNRSTANYLLAMAANIKECQPFIRKYFKYAVRLPSDWLDVAATYQSMPDKSTILLSFNINSTANITSYI